MNSICAVMSGAFIDWWHGYGLFTDSCGLTLELVFYRHLMVCKCHQDFCRCEPLFSPVTCEVENNDITDVTYCRIDVFHAIPITYND